jgi:hypothetical protein
MAAKAHTNMPPPPVMPSTTPQGSHDQKQGLLAGQLINKYTIYSLDANFLIPPDQVLVDETNRDGVFVKSSDCIANALGHCTTGYDHSKARHVCIEVPREQMKLNELMEYNQKAAELDPALPLVIVDKVAYSGLGGNHDNVFCRMVVQGRKSPRR